MFHASLTHDELIRFAQMADEDAHYLEHVRKDHTGAGFHEYDALLARQMAREILDQHTK